METLNINRRKNEENQPRQRSAFECFIIIIFVAIMGYFLIFSEVPVLP